MCVCVCVCVRERERETETERQTDRDRQRQTDRQRQIDRQTERQTETEAGRQADREFGSLKTPESRSSQAPRALCETPHVPCGIYIMPWVTARRVIVQELCESRGGRPGLSVLTSLLVSVDVKIY